MITFQGAQPTHPGTRINRNEARSSGGSTGCALCAAIVLVSNSSLAQVTDEPVVAPSGQVELARLVDLCAERLSLNIEYDARTLKEEVTLRLGGGVSNEELWQLTNQLLVTRGYTSVQPPGHDVVSIVKLTHAPNLARVDRPGEAPALAGFSSAIVAIEHRPPQEIADAIKPLLSKPGGSVQRVGTGDLILISDLKPRMQQVLELIEILDLSSAPPVVERVPANNLPATQLASLATAAATARSTFDARPLQGKLSPLPDGSAVILVAPADELEDWHELLEEFDRREEVVNRSYAPRHFSIGEVGRLVEQTARDTGPRGAGDRWRIVTDDLTGSLIVIATPSEHEQIATLVERLDEVPVEARRPVRAFPIRNRGVNEVLDVITQLMEAGVFQGGAFETTLGTPSLDRRQQSRRDTAPVAPDSSLQPVSAGAGRGDVGLAPLTLTADEGTNTLIAMGDARLLGQLEQLLKTIDIRQPQVMLEVLVIALTDDETFDLGVELQKLEVTGETLISLSSLFGLSGIGVADSAIPRPGGVGGTGIILRPADFSIVIRALETVNEGRSLTMPKVLVNSNQTATLDSVLQEPFVSVNASDTVATTSFGGTQDAGTTVTVVPQIAEGDHLVLEYSVSLSSFVGESGDPAIPPPRQQNNLQSVVTIPDGYTVVVGGLEVQTDADAESRVPLLGSIPILGEAFKSRSKSKTRTRFYVFIRPTILRHQGFEDLKYLSDQDLIAVDIDDGWPEVEPRIIR